MANDPNRDLLPVKEDCSRTKQGHSERVDHQTLSKLSRCELEDKIHELLDEQICLKKLANSQEEKIKRLGTKLLRLINDKKHGGRNSEQLKVSEDLHFQLVELEHENYALKDKITVLRQQLSSHTRHTAIRSPVRSNHTSPLMSMRQSASHFHNEIAFQSTNKTSAADVQLQEAEAHIKLLNNEIKSLHSKIEYLQQDLEKNSLDNRKTKVTENIEFIRLQRSLKQQAIQITALQAQIKNSENNQKILKEELLKAHNENDEALHLIAVKQNEILNLCGKLEEKKLSRLEEDDLKQRINDLMAERDSLKERADLLMKTIEGKPDHTEKIKMLQMLLAQEKCKTKKLEEILSIKATYCTNLNYSFKESAASHENPTESVEVVVPLSEKKEEHMITDTNANITESLLRKTSYGQTKDGWTCPMPQNSSMECKSVQTESISAGLVTVKDSEITGDTVERDSGEKIKLELEVQYLREMLRSQTSRCEAQQAEINRLTLELKLNEDKCKKTLQKLDKRLSVFENLEKQSYREVISSPRKINYHRASAIPMRPNPAPRSSRVSREIHEGNVINERVINKNNETEKSNKPMFDADGGLDSNTYSASRTPQVNSGISVEMLQTKKRFVDQVFLESSDEDQANNAPLKGDSSLKNISDNEDPDGILLSKKRTSVGKERKSLTSNKSKTETENVSPIFSELKLSSKPNLSEQKEQSKVINEKVRKKISKEELHKVSISILWLAIEENSSLWHNNMIKLLFIDFSFLDLRGESTETPESLPKPTSVGQKCEFNFTREMEVGEVRKRILLSLMNKPDLDLIIFKVVSDSEDFDELTNFDCEDVGVAVVTVKQFLENYNKGPFTIPVKNTQDTKEVIGMVAVSIEVTPGLFNSINSL